jgi:O-antigen/teichoic acid export membrane protein
MRKRLIPLADTYRKAVDQIRTFIPKGDFVRSVATLTRGTVMGQILVILASPVLTRWYSPADFGVLAAFISLFSLLLIVNSLRYELAIPIAEDNQTAAELLILVFTLVVLTTAAFGLIFWLFPDQIAGLLNAPQIKPYLWLLVLCLMGAGFYQALTYWAIRKEAFSIIAQSKLTQSIGLVVIQLALGFISIGTGGLLSGYTVGQFTGILPLLQLIGPDDHRMIRNTHLSGIIKTAKRYRRFPLLSSWSSLLNSGGLQLPTLLIIGIYGPAFAGLFALTQRLIGIPIVVIGNSVSQVYFASASQLALDNPTALMRFFLRIARLSFLISVVPVFFIALIGPWLFEHLLGPEWRTAGELVQIMAPMFVTQTVVPPLSQTIFILERQDIQVLWDLGRLLMVAGTFIGSSILHLEPKTAIGLYVVTMCFTDIILFLINRHLLQRHVQNAVNRENAAAADARDQDSIK